MSVSDDEQWRMDKISALMNMEEERFDCARCCHGHKYGPCEVCGCSAHAAKPEAFNLTARQKAEMQYLGSRNGKVMYKTMPRDVVLALEKKGLVEVRTWTDQVQLKSGKVVDRRNRYVLWKGDGVEMGKRLWEEFRIVNAGLKVGDRQPEAEARAQIEAERSKP